MCPDLWRPHLLILRGPHGLCKKQSIYGHNRTECLKCGLDYRTPRPPGSPFLTVSGACQWPHVVTASGPLLVPTPFSLRKGDSCGGNVTPDKQISILGLAEIRPLKAIKLKIKQKFNENWKYNPYYVAIKNDVYREFVITWKMLVSLRWARKEQITKLCVQLITITFERYIVKRLEFNTL